MSRVVPIVRTSTGDFGIPALAVDAVHAAVTDTGVPQTITAGITSPDRPRRITATAGGTATDIKAITVTIVGTDEAGAVLTEVLPAFTVNTAGTVTGVLKFRTVTSFTLPAHDGTGATTSIGAADLPIGDCHVTSVTLTPAAATALCTVKDKQTVPGEIISLQALVSGASVVWAPGGKVLCKGGVELTTLTGAGAKVTVTVK